LSLQDGDELIVADNTGEGVVVAVRARDSRWRQVRVVPAAGQPSAYYARNRGAEHARNDWLLFIDGDCHPVPSLLDAYFEPAPRDRDGALAGAVLGSPGQRSLAARYARSRRYLDQEVCLAHPYKPAAVTANLLCRRQAFEDAGGFIEGVRSGEDWDFSWRVQEAGWALGFRAEALAYHDHRDTVAGLLHQVHRDAAGRAWLVERRPEAFDREPRLRDATRALMSAARWAATGKPERAAFRALDALVDAANAIGERSSNHLDAG
jgi:GT2 family glycosyltransferase